MYTSEIEKAVEQILHEVKGEHLPSGLKDTPRRYARVLQELLCGELFPEEVVKEMLSTKFSLEEEEYSEGKKVIPSREQLILLRDIEMYSLCEHHLLPFFGKAHVAYISRGEDVLGVSKLARLVEVYSRRITIQERIGEQVTSALMTFANARGAACIIEADHMCIRMRGVNKQHSTMVTNSMKGVFLSNDASRAELLQLIR